MPDTPLSLWQRLIMRYRLLTESTISQQSSGKFWLGWQLNSRYPWPLWTVPWPTLPPLPTTKW